MSVFVESFEGLMSEVKEIGTIDMIRSFGYLFEGFVSELETVVIFEDFAVEFDKTSGSKDLEMRLT